MTDTPDTIRQWLANISKGEPLGEGENADVWEIPGTNHLLRSLRHDDEDKTLNGFADFLARTTTLTPVEIRGKANGIEKLLLPSVSQPVLSGYHDLFEIVERVPGDTLVNVMWQRIHDAGGMETTEGMMNGQKQLIEELTDLPDKSWRDLIEQIGELSRHGLTVEFLMKNVMYDKDTQTLNMIDVGYGGRSYNHPERKGMISPIAAMNDWPSNVHEFIQEDFGPNSLWLTDMEQMPITEALEPCIEKLRAKMLRCGEQAKGPTTRDKIRAEHAEGKIAFARMEKLADPVLGSELSLEDSPKALIERLKALEARSASLRAANLH